MDMGKKDQISVASNEIVTMALEAIVTEMDNAGIRVLGRKFTKQAMLNGLVLYLASAPREERFRIIEASVGWVESLTVREGRSEKLEQFARYIGTHLNLEAASPSVDAVPAPHEFEGPPIPETGVGPGRLLNDAEPKRKRPRKAK